MHKPFPILLLSFFFVLRGVQAAPHLSSLPVLPPCKNGYVTRSGDHNPPNLIIIYCPSGEHYQSRRRGFSGRMDFVPERTISIFATAKGLAGYTANELSLQFYTYRAGTFSRIAPQTDFTLGPMAGRVSPLKLTKSLVTPYGRRGKAGEPTAVTFQFRLKPDAALPLHLLVVASLNYTRAGSEGTVLAKGPVFSTMVLENRQSSGYHNTIFTKRQHTP